MPNIFLCNYCKQIAPRSEKNLLRSYPEVVVVIVRGVLSTHTASNLMICDGLQKVSKKTFLIFLYIGYNIGYNVFFSRKKVP